MASAELSSHSTVPSAEISALNSYGALSHSNDLNVLTPTTVTIPVPVHDDECDSTIVDRYKPRKSPCLKPQQSETIFAIFLFLLGLSLLIYVIVSYWFTHSQISPIIIFICGLLCFIPGFYYLADNYCYFIPCKRNRRRQLQIIEQDDSI